MTNDKTWIEQIAEVINDENRVDESRVTRVLEELAKEYGKNQNVRTEVDYLNGGGWSVTLKKVNVRFGIDALPFKLGESLNDAELKGELETLLVELFIKN